MEPFNFSVASKLLLSLFITNKQSTGLVSKRAALRKDIPVTAENLKSGAQLHDSHLTDEHTASLVTQETGLVSIPRQYMWNLLRKKWQGRYCY